MHHAFGWGGDGSVVRLLLELGADPMAQNARGELADATRCENWRNPQFMAEATPEQVTACLAAGHDINTRDNHGATLLHHAAANADSAAVAFLLARGADANARDHLSTPPNTPNLSLIHISEPTRPY